MTAIYSLAEVANHKSKGDLWLVIHGKVYDVSKFVEDHPGGERAIYDEAGSDASAVFEDIGHSEFAYDKLTELYIGDVEGEAAVVEKEVSNKSDTPIASPTSENKTAGSALRVVIPTVIVAGILFYKFVWAPQQKN